MEREKITDKNGDEIEIISRVSNNIPDKLKGTCLLFSVLVKKRPLKVAIKSTLHEASHMFADSGSGIVGIKSHREGGKIRKRACYAATGLRRSAMERLRISRAPRKIGLSMSMKDIKNEEVAVWEMAINDMEDVMNP